jgi:DNA-binding LytR/AlgR family response regulator
MKYSVVIIDDEILAVELLADYCSKLDNLEVKGTFTDPHKAYNYLSTHQIDLVFLDINMPELGGLDLARVLSPATRLIFATAYREFGVEAFELKALDYLLKPIAYPRFLQAVQRFLETQGLRGQPESDHLIIRVDRRDHKVELNDIQYIEGLKDYVKIHLGKGVLLTKDSVGLFMKKLPADRFLRIHKSYIVNKGKVNAVGNEEILIGGKSLPVGITFRKEVRDLFTT